MKKNQAIELWDAILSYADALVEVQVLGASYEAFREANSESGDFQRSVLQQRTKELANIFAKRTGWMPKFIKNEHTELWILEKAI